MSFTFVWSWQSSLPWRQEIWWRVEAIKFKVLDKVIFNKKVLVFFFFFFFFFLFLHKNVCLFYLGLCCFQNSFSHIAMLSGHDRELNARFQSAASLKYDAPDTQHNIPHSHFVLTLGWPVLIPSCVPSKRAASTILKSLVKSQAGL